MKDLEIRGLQRGDYEQAFELMKEFAKFTGHPGFIGREYDFMPVKHILLRCHYSGASFVAVSGNKMVGILLSMATPDIWIPDIIRLRELAWFVTEEYRNSSVGARLYSLYKKQAENMMKEGKIHGFTMTKLANSPDFDYEKGGFKFMEATYLLGV